MSYFSKYPRAAFAILVAGLCMTSAAKAEQFSGAEFQSTHAGQCVSYAGPSIGTQCLDANGSTNYTDQS